MKKNILKIDGFFLAIMGTLAGITDLVSYFTGKGPFGHVYFQNSIAIGGFEYLYKTLTKMFIIWEKCWR